MKCASCARPFRGVGLKPQWTEPNPAQLEAQVIVTLVAPTCTEGPVEIEHTVGMEVKVQVAVGVKVGVEVDVNV